MRLNLHPEASRNFDLKADAIASTLAKVSGLVYVREAPTSASHLPVKTLPLVELAKLPQPFVTSRSRDNELTGATFFVGTEAYQLPAEGVELLKALVQSFLKKEPMSSTLSAHYVEQCMLDWLVSRLRGDMSSWVAYQESRVAADVSERRIAFPVQWCEIEREFSVGGVLFSFYTASDVIALEERMAPLGAPRTEFGASLSRALQGKVLASTTVLAEQHRAMEIAGEVVDLALDVLVFLSTSATRVQTRSYLGREGNALRPRVTYISFRGEIPELISDSEPLEFGTPTKIGAAAFAHHEKNVRALERVMRAGTEFEFSLRTAVRQVAAAARGPKTTEKLAGVLVAIETMLLRNGSEPITRNLGLRIAHILGSNLEEKRRILASITAAYAMRSRFVHHGEHTSDSGDVDAALEIFRRTLLVLAESTEYSKREELFESLEDKILS